MTAKLEWTDVGMLADIPRRGARQVVTPDGPIAVFRTHDDAVYAIVDRCPHKGGPLSQGIVHGAAVTCPLHNWVIDLQTGAAMGADEGCARTVPVRVVEGRVSLGMRVVAERAA
ncbi:nitrite reductase small subunit NirD [Thalassobaculum sp.]|uniref:nitrite reductase small subunit NirD n=1 Tax=Thalassobaculum sp. TaxID=2022740 RepID=UPI0032F02D24